MRLLEDAASNQMRVHQEKPDRAGAWRYRSLKPGYRHDVLTGTVLDGKDEPHEFNGIWLCGGQLLLCETCYEDAT